MKEQRNPEERTQSTTSLTSPASSVEDHTSDQNVLISREKENSNATNAEKLDTLQQLVEAETQQEARENLQQPQEQQTHLHQRQDQVHLQHRQKDQEEKKRRTRKRNPKEDLTEQPVKKTDQAEKKEGNEEQDELQAKQKRRKSLCQIQIS